MPGRFGRVGISAFCVLDLVGSTLTMEMRPRWLWRRFADGGGRLVVCAGEALIFPASRSKWRFHSGNEFGYMHPWIGVQPEGSPVYYFYPSSSAVEGVLDALEDAGFKVSRDGQPFKEA
jgi:hypothetical protein